MINTLTTLEKTICKNRFFILFGVKIKRFILLYYVYIIAAQKSKLDMNIMKKREFFCL